MKDIQALRNNNYKIDIDDQLNNLIVWINAPIESLYKNYSFDIKVYFPSNYPYNSPSIGFVTKIFHPNIDFNSGSICLDVIN